MKTSLITLLILVVSVGYAQNKKYVKTMETTIESLNNAGGLDEFDPIINKFARIGQAEATQWEPFYYAAQGHVFKSFRIDNLAQKDEVLNQALTALSSASELSKNNAEILALEGFINMLKISVDPGTRGQQLSPKIMASYSQALAIEPDNPRANLFMAQMQIGTAMFFGTGTEEPCKMVKKSLELFNAEKSSEPLAPKWGSDMAMQYAKTCKIETGGTSGN